MFYQNHINPFLHSILITFLLILAKKKKKFMILAHAPSFSLGGKTVILANLILHPQLTLSAIHFSCFQHNISREKRTERRKNWEDSSRLSLNRVRHNNKKKEEPTYSNSWSHSRLSVFCQLEKHTKGARSITFGSLSFLLTHSHTKKETATGWIGACNFIKILVKRLQFSLRYVFFFFFHAFFFP